MLALVGLKTSQETFSNPGATGCVWGAACSWAVMPWALLAEPGQSLTWSMAMWALRTRHAGGTTWALELEGLKLTILFCIHLLCALT